MIIFLDVDGVLWDKRSGVPFAGAAEAVNALAEKVGASIVWTTSRRATMTPTQLAAAFGVTAPVAGSAPVDGALYAGDQHEQMTRRRATEIAATLEAHGWPDYIVIDDGDMRQHGLRQVVTDYRKGLSAADLTEMPPHTGVEQSILARASVLSGMVNVDV